MALTIPAGWTQSPGCLPSGDLWGWAVSQGFYADMFGGPSVTSSCYPPSYQPTSGVVYATDACPDGFTRACPTSTGGSSFTVCCPTAYPFSCQGPMVLDVATMFCRSRRPGETSREWVTSSFTKFAPGLQSVETYTATVNVRDVDTPSRLVVTTSGPILASDIRGPGQELFAMPVLITGTSPSPSSTEQTSSNELDRSSTTPAASTTSQAATGPATGPTTSTASPSSPGLSTGAAAGIGAGAGAAALLVACGGWFLYRRGVARGRRAAGSRRAKPADLEVESTTTAPPQQPTHVNHHGAYYDNMHELGPAPPGLTELEPAPPRPRELEPTPPRPRELE